MSVFSTLINTKILESNIFVLYKHFIITSPVFF